MHSPSKSSTNDAAKHLAKRHKSEARFQFYGICAIILAFVILIYLLYSLIIPGISGLQSSEFKIKVTLEEQLKTPKDVKRYANKLYRQAVRDAFPHITERADKRQLYKLFSRSSAESIRNHWQSPKNMSQRSAELWFPASDMADMYIKGKIDSNISELERPIKDIQISWIKQLNMQQRVQTIFNTGFFTKGDSRKPENAGIGSAIIGSLLTMLVCLAVSFPLGVASAVYLEEFSKKGRIRDIIEVNINNLAAVPSIVFGLLGLSVYLNFFELPRSAPIVGGLTLALMTLPVIIITTRIALQSIPDSIRQAAMGLGASPLQVVMHHTLPLAMPGIMTGTILGMARAIGETAPLLMIGMVAFIVDVPSGIFDSATVMPVQIYIWASSPEMGFAEKTASGILILIMLLLLMNGLAIYLRKKYERKW